METTKLGKYIVSYTNSSEYHSLKGEIFNNEIYNFELDNENPEIIDVGAHIGLSVLYFKQLYPNSHILAFEPNPFVINILKENIFQNALENVDIVDMAVSNKEGELVFNLDNSVEKWFSTAGIINGGWKKSQSTSSIFVPCTLLSKYINKTIDILKIDIEGSELTVLKEIKKQLDSVKNIAIEYHPVQQNSIDEIIKILKSAGFMLTYVVDGKIVKNPEPKKLQIIKGIKIV